MFERKPPTLIKPEATLCDRIDWRNAHSTSSGSTVTVTSTGKKKANAIHFEEAFLVGSGIRAGPAPASAYLHETPSRTTCCQAPHSRKTSTFTKPRTQTAFKRRAVGVTDANASQGTEVQSAVT